MYVQGVFLVLLSLAIVASSGFQVNPVDQTNLYRVLIKDRGQAEVLSQSGLDALLRVSGGYLVLANPNEMALLDVSKIEYSLIATDVSRDILAMDNAHDRSNVGRYPLIYEEGGLRLFRVTPNDWKQAKSLAPILSRDLPVIFKETPAVKSIPALATEGLDSILNQIRQDSLQSYVEHLQSYDGRLTGTYGDFSSAYWIAGQFAQYGYDSVVIDTFTENIYGSNTLCRNVVAYKPGTTYPYDQIIIGAHRDAAEGSPGADDNGSGTAAVMEIARVLRNIDTKMTIIFILFGAEEQGLYGAWHYARTAALAGDRIVLMLNMDMIAHYENQNDAEVYHPWYDTEFAQLWATVAATEPSIHITTHLTPGLSSGSDQAPFYAYGYDAFWVQEYIFSTVYHEPLDSTAYMNFEYMRRMTMATMGTALVVDSIMTPAPDILFYLSSDPPPLLLPGISNSLEARIFGYAGGAVVPGSPQLHYTIAGQPPDSVPMTAIGDDVYSVDIPMPECLSEITYYLSAEEVSSGPMYYPGPDSSFRSTTATGIASFEDDFETDKGWTVWGDARIGHWERVAADDAWSGTGLDYDGSGICYITGGEGWSDVEGGASNLRSPAITVPQTEVYVEFAVYYTAYTNGYPPDDIFDVFLYNGAAATRILTLGPVEGVSHHWKLFRFRVRDYFNPTAPLSVKFVVSDTGRSSTVAAGVDAFKVTWLSSGPIIMTEALPACTVGIPYPCRIEGSSCAVPLAWSDVHGNLAGTGLTFSTDGLVSGTASDTGRVMFLARVTDTAGLTAEKWFTIRIKSGYLCGDANGDETVNVGDAVHLIAYIFKGGSAPNPVCGADANGDKITNVADAVYLINYVFKGGAAPVMGCCAP